MVFQSFPGLFCLVVAICCGVKWYWASSRQIRCSCARTARCSHASEEASMSRGSLKRRRISRRHSGGRSDHWGCCSSSGYNNSFVINQPLSWISLKSLHPNFYITNFYCVTWVIVIDEAICNILSRAALCFSHRITEPKGLPPQQQPALKARTLSIRRRSLPVCCCDSDTKTTINSAWIIKLIFLFL